MVSTWACVSSALAVGAALVLSGALAACAGPDRPKPLNETSAHPAPARATPRSEAACFTSIPGAHVAIEDLPDGIELTYAAEVDEAPALRAAIRDLAARQNGAHAVKGGPGDVALRPGDSIAPPMTTLLAPGARATVTDTPLGARLTLGPLTPEARALLRAELRAREASSSTGNACPPDVRLSPYPAPGRAN